MPIKQWVVIIAHITLIIIKVEPNVNNPKKVNCCESNERAYCRTQNDSNLRKKTKTIGDFFLR